MLPVAVLSVIAPAEFNKDKLLVEALKICESPNAGLAEAGLPPPKTTIDVPAGKIVFAANRCRSTSLPLELCVRIS
jgi:hypothetical protein